MTKQNFGSFISQALLSKVSFDFYENGQDTFKTRAKFYDKLIEEVVSAENKKRAFIAGGYFIKYKREKFGQAEQYEEYCSNQDVNIYVNVGKKYYQPTDDEIRTMVNTKYNERFQIDEERKQNFSSIVLKIDQVELDTKEIVKNIRIHLCLVTCNEMLRSFTFEPCKIAYCYKSNRLTASYWFFQGGRRGSSNDLSVNAEKLKERYCLKNINSDDSFGTEKKVEFVVKSASNQKMNRIVKRIGIRQKSQSTITKFFQKK
jgi:hypothetical protein